MGCDRSVLGASAPHVLSVLLLVTHPLAVQCGMNATRRGPVFRISRPTPSADTPPTTIGTMKRFCITTRILRLNAKALR